MQHIQIGGGQYTKYFSYLYNILSETKNLPNEVIIPNKECGKLIDFIYEYYNTPAPIKTLKTRLLPYLDLESSNSEMMVTFSGGKDSTAAALRCAEEGYKVTCVNLLNLEVGRNSSEKNKRICDINHFDFIKVPLRKEGYSDTVENPVRSLLPYCVCIDLMEEYDEAIPCVGGLHNHNTINTIVDRVSGLTDSPEIFKLFVIAIRKTFPSFKLYSVIPDQASSFYYLYYQYPESFKLTQGCMSRMGSYSFATQKRLNRNQVYLKTDLGCGRCYKCISDILYLNRADGLDEYYGFLDKDAFIEDSYKKAFSMISRGVYDKKKVDEHFLSSEIMHYVDDGFFNSATQSEKKALFRKILQFKEVC